MLLRANTVAIARVAAVLVAATLSGAPRVLAMHAPVEGHRCSCSAHGGRGRAQCECALCRKASRAAHRPEAAAASAAHEQGRPRCHPPAEQKGERGEPPASQGAPCIEGTCGAIGHVMSTPAGVEPFCLTAVRPVPLADRAEARITVPEHGRVQPHAPETPPPRAA
jgi:hypothetical protein